MAGDLRRGFNPVLQIAPHRVAFLRGEFWIVDGLTGHRGHMEVCGPERLRQERKAERQVVSRLLRGSDGRMNECLPDPVLTLVAQNLAPASRGLVIGSLLLEGIFDFEEIAEVGPEVHTQLNVRYFAAVVENGQIFYEAVADKTAPHE